jgi:hypothetical protein
MAKSPRSESNTNKSPDFPPRIAQHRSFNTRELLKLPKTDHLSGMNDLEGVKISNVPPKLPSVPPFSLSSRSPQVYPLLLSSSPSAAALPETDFR